MTILPILFIIVGVLALLSALFLVCGFVICNERCDRCHTRIGVPMISLITMLVSGVSLVVIGVAMTGMVKHIGG